MGIHDEPSVGAFMTGKKYVTKMKSLKKSYVKKHDSNSDADEDWLTFMNSRGWTEDQIKRGM